ncbi:hypothetical protein [Streptomyces rimosus]|uniref:hypothetical protein n=1 Tax=Streptomyces rimosus TaxID=1927 RepID=UPI001F3C2349|nr:hypothetical protein [Streptomyces rimosus]
MAVWATLPGEGGYGADRLRYVLLGDAWLFGYFGVPSLFILMFLSRRRTLREQDEFRVLASFLLMIPMVPWLVLVHGYAGGFIFPGIQLVFVWLLLPLPTRCVLASVEPGRERERQRWAK